MLPGTKRRSPTWQQSLLLLIFGLIVGYPSCVGVGQGMWGGASPHQGLYVVGAFVAAVAFIAGILGFLETSVRMLTSPPAVGPAATPSPHASAGPVSRATHPQLFPDAGVERTQPISSETTAALVRLRVALIGAIVLAAFDLWRSGGPPLNSSYGQHYLVVSVIACVLGQVPFGVALLRTWSIPDRAGLALAMVAGAAQVLIPLAFFNNLRYSSAAQGSWLWLSVFVGLTVVILAYIAWRPSFSRKGDAGILVSMLFGFLVYTEVAQIARSILAAHWRV
jgi:hypothetical protein